MVDLLPLHLLITEEAAPLEVMGEEVRVQESQAAGTMAVASEVAKMGARTVGPMEPGDQTVNRPPTAGQPQTHRQCFLTGSPPSGRLP